MEHPIQGKTIFSGLKPSGDIHLGNYLGALQQWVLLQEHNKAYYCIVDLHAITVPYTPLELTKRTLDAAALYMALGIDLDKSVVFVQSHVHAHAELAWLLSTFTPYGELTRMTQFKDKYRAKKQAVSVGLFSYPVLMAADILLYSSDIVPVGEDQVQHLELTRDIAKRFNTTFGETFKLPTAFVPQSTARIMSLTDPSKKMSKSEDEKGCINLLDTPDVIRKKIQSAVTDTTPVISFTKGGKAVKNLLTIYQALSQQSPEQIEEKFAGKGYKELKEDLSQLVIDTLAPIQDKFNTIRAEETELRVLLGKGMHQAQSKAQQKLHEVKEKMGLL